MKRGRISAYLSGSVGVAALVLLTTPALAGVDRWSSQGPEGGPVRVVVGSTSNPAILYAGTLGGIFKSVDRGANWAAVNAGLPRLRIRALAVDPRNPSRIYASLDNPTEEQNVFKSTDGGASWRPAGTGLPTGVVNSLAVDPADSATLYAGTDAGVYKSADSARRWVPTGLSEPGIGPIVIDPANPSILYAGGAGLHKSTDAGATWSSIDAGLTAQGISSIAIDPITPSTLYAATFSPGGVFKSIDGGANWSAIDAGLPAGSGLSAGSVLAVDPRNPSVVYVGYRSGAGIFRSADGGASWTVAGNLANGAVVLSLLVDGGAPSTVFVGTPVGLFALPGGVGDWEARNGGMNNSPIASLALDPATPSVLYAGSGSFFGNGGVFKSADSARTWREARPTAGPVVGLAVDPFNPSVVYAAASGSGVLRSSDGGERWVPLNVDVEETQFNAIAVDPVSPSVVYAGGTDGGLFRSRDAGATWNRLPLPRVRAIHALAIDPTNSSVLYVGVRAQVFVDVSLYKSADSGATWSEADAGLPAGAVSALAIDPQLPSTVFAAAGTVYKSEDGGQHWLAADGGLDIRGVSALAIDPTGSNTLYAATSDNGRGTGVYRSRDGGQTWSAFNDGLTNLDVPALAIDSTGRSLYAGTSGSGVFSYEIVSQEPCVPDATSLCLNGGRFRVEAAWRVPSQGTGGPGAAVPLTPDTGYFWFFNAENVEVIVKVLDGCVINDHSWVFAGGLTNVEVTLSVTDSQTGEVKTYVNPADTAFLPIQDTAAFASCPAPASSAGAVRQPPALPTTPGETSRLSAGQAGPKSALQCVAGSTTLCLNGGRFRVQSEWHVPSQGTSGQGRAVALTPDTGYFWFFSAENVEIVVKVLAGCVLNQHFWVFAGGLTDVGVRLTVTDTESGEVKTYVNPAGTAFLPIQDTAAFAACS